MTRLGEEWIIYKMIDGSQIYGEFDWVTDLEFFEGSDDPCEIVKETWLLVKSEMITYPEREPDEDEEEEVSS